MTQRWLHSCCWHFGWSSNLNLQRSQKIIRQTAYPPQRLPWKWRQKSHLKHRLKFTNQHVTLQPSGIKYSVSTAETRDKEQIPCFKNSRQMYYSIKKELDYMSRVVHIIQIWLLLTASNNFVSRYHCFGTTCFFHLKTRSVDTESRARIVPYKIGN